jgi:hypothetical protein
MTLLHACASQPNVPLEIPLRLLELGADPQALSYVHRNYGQDGLASQQLSVLASAIYHRSAQTQLALLTCSRLVLLSSSDESPWCEDGYCSGYEQPAVWPSQRENQAAGTKQSLWWRDNLDAAFRFIFLAREYFVQLASGHVVMRLYPSSEQATTRQWSRDAVDNFDHNTLLSFVEEKLSTMQPDLLFLVYLLVTEGTDAATDYAHGRHADDKPSSADMAEGIVKRIEVRHTSNEIRWLQRCHSNSNMLLTPEWMHDSCALAGRSASAVQEC